MVDRQHHECLSSLMHPRLVVTYLRSYNGLGNVTATLNDQSIEQSKHVSQVYMKVFLVSSDAIKKC